MALLAMLPASPHVAEIVWRGDPADADLAFSGSEHEGLDVQRTCGRSGSASGIVARHA
jgi:hypothetical protein